MKLNLGSGITSVASLNVIALDQTGWKHIDICAAYNPHECYDITTGIREQDNSVEEIWMGDFFEHIMRKHTKFLLQECCRVLQPGGRLRISVPDMEQIMPKWLKNGEDESGSIWGGQGDAHDGTNAIADTHFNGYIEVSLKKLLLSAGFKTINRIRIHIHSCELSVEAYK
jgi:hypothetical protein